MAARFGFKWGKFGSSAASSATGSSHCFSRSGSIDNKKALEGFSNIWSASNKCQTAELERRPSYFGSFTNTGTGLQDTLSYGSVNSSRTSFTDRPTFVRSNSGLSVCSGYSISDQAKLHFIPEESNAVSASVAPSASNLDELDDSVEYSGFDQETGLDIQTTAYQCSANQSSASGSRASQSKYSQVDPVTVTSVTASEYSQG